MIERTKELEEAYKKLKNEILERKKAEEYSNRSKQNLRNIIDSASELIVSFDMNNRISLWNKSAEKIIENGGKNVVNETCRICQILIKRGVFPLACESCPSEE